MTRAELIEKLDRIIWDESSEAERKAMKTPGYDDIVWHPVRKIEFWLGQTMQDLYSRFNWTKEDLSAWFDKDEQFVQTMIYWEN